MASRDTMAGGKRCPGRNDLDKGRGIVKIGVIADNHSGTADGADVPQQVVDGYAGVDLSVPCGVAGDWGTLARLALVAPVVGVLGGHNGNGEDKRISGKKRVSDAGGLRAGIVHDLVSQGVTTESHPTLRPAKGDLGDG